MDHLHLEVEDDPTAAATDSATRERLDRCRSTLPRVTRGVLWTTLTLLVLREAAAGVVALRRRAARTITFWWDDIDRQLQRETRHAEIDLVASRLARKRPRRDTGTS